MIPINDDTIPSSFTYSSIPAPHDRREEEDQMREAIAASLGITVDSVDPELVRRNLGRSPSTGGNSHSRRRTHSRPLPALDHGVFC
jgi:hypothetical protein